MNYQISSQKNFQKAISPEQFEQVIEAITDGRYSWACVLILRFVGYNPLHFIPQRTYSRLIKENSNVSNSPISTRQNS
ncbi:HetP family heterocyst commitment protein [Nostoc sp. PA-18-2419]|uniref:HetP family heterocyst commitment protein n=1 Tax=Nostoc sp. PA-18-2419 TaxID=2575443 RepID=UPI001107C83B|nr:HetP family heterocyst commitment protein [Nostoc sp. PA-18-2419]